jgi:RNA polymerase sigma-70 factor (ECF subfamily)
VRVNVGAATRRLRTRLYTFPERRRELLDCLLLAFVAAWERADVPAILGMLVEDARFTMPPLLAWLHGLADIGRFLTERMFATSWRVVPMWASGQLAFACYQGSPDGTGFRLGALNVLTLRGGRIVEMTGFLDPEIHVRFGLPEEWPDLLRSDLAGAL